MKARRAHRRARARRGEIAWSTPPRRGLRLRHALSFLVVGVLLVPWVRSWSTQGPASASLLPFERRELGPLLTDSADGMHVLTNCSSARDIQRYAGGWWVATGGGLIAVPSNPDGRALVFGRPAGLPDHDIRCLAAFRGGLLLGTAQAGVVWYRNGRLTTFSAPDASWMNVHALLPMGGDRVLVGTQGGLLEFDGVSWRRACPDGRRSVPAPVTSLVLWNGRPAVGTPEGLYVVAPTRRSGGVQLRCIGTADGLPSAAVTSLATWGDSLVVGAAGGTALLTPDMAVKILDAPRNVTAVAHTAAGLWAGTGEGYVVAPQCEGVARLGRVNRLIPAGGRLVAATENGLFTHRGGTDWSPWPNLPESGLSDNVVTALADDPDGRVWVGYGSGDVDVLDADSSTRLRRLRGPYAAPVSWIARDEETGTMWVSTPRGLWSAAPGRGDVGTVPALSPSSILTFVGRQGRLLAAQASRLGNWLFEPWLRGRRVTAVARHGRLLALGSRHGLSLVDPGAQARGRGAAARGRPFAAWVTALLPLGDDLYVGTSSDGLALVNPAGGWRSMARELGRFSVSPRAMSHDGARVVVGTRTRGAYVFDPVSGWRVVRDDLPSLRVNAVLASPGRLWFGTDRGLACHATARAAIGDG